MDADESQGTQMYFGGQGFVIILNSIFPSFLHMKTRYQRGEIEILNGGRLL